LFQSELERLLQLGLRVRSEGLVHRND
jgi:hypothetical protein